MGLYIPMRGLSALSVLTVWAMREPRYRGTGSSKITTLFHFVEGTYWALNKNIIIGSLMMEKMNKIIYGEYFGLYS